MSNQKRSLTNAEFICHSVRIMLLNSFAKHLFIMTKKRTYCKINALSIVSQFSGHQNPSSLGIMYDKFVVYS